MIHYVSLKMPTVWYLNSNSLNDIFLKMLDQIHIYRVKSSGLNLGRKKQKTQNQLDSY